MVGCNDQFSNCQSFACNERIRINGEQRFVYQVCPRTCNQCQPLRCSDALNVCENGGSCFDNFSTSNGLIGFRCDCPPGFTGEYCETNINPCASNPCLNGGTCFSVTNSLYLCLCPSSCSASNCANCLFANPITTNRPVQLAQSSTQATTAKCDDQSQFCVVFSQYCNDLAFFERKTIREVCPKTCNACSSTPCVDAQSNCANFRSLCQYFDSNYFSGNWLTHPCYKTCGNC